MVKDLNVSFPYEDLDKQEDEERYAEYDKILVIDDVVIVLEACPVDNDETDKDPDRDYYIARHTQQRETGHQCLLTMVSPVVPTRQEDIGQTCQPN